MYPSVKVLGSLVTNRSETAIFCTYVLNDTLYVRSCTTFCQDSLFYIHLLTILDNFYSILHIINMSQRSKIIFFNVLTKSIANKGKELIMRQFGQISHPDFGYCKCCNLVLIMRTASLGPWELSVSNSKLYTRIAGKGAWNSTVQLHLSGWAGPFV